MEDISKLSEAQLIERVHTLLEYLSSGYEAKMVPPEQLDNGLIQVGWFDYGPQIWEGILAAMALLGTDYTYTQHIESVVKREIAVATPRELSTWFTWMSRGERFCDGFLASKIADGELEAISRRLVELIAAGEINSNPRDYK